MSDSELAIAGFFDHEHEVVREKQRRIPDWGGDDVFATTPRRRRFEHAEDRTAPHLRLREASELPIPILDAPAAPQAPAAEDLLVVEEPVLPIDAYLEEPAAVAANGRRSVTITGHPGATRVTRSPDAARRPERSWEDRFVHRPERIAMWAFALGLLLIVIAIASS